MKPGALRHVWETSDSFAVGPVLAPAFPAADQVSAKWRAASGGPTSQTVDLFAKIALVAANLIAPTMLIPVRIHWRCAEIIKIKSIVNDPTSFVAFRVLSCVSWATF
jgi:hypothetical protein